MFDTVKVDDKLLEVHYNLQMLNNSEKNRQINGHHENILKKSVGPCKKIEVKGGHLVKKWEFGNKNSNSS